MKMRRTAAVLAMVVAASVGVGVGPAQAQTTYEIQVGVFSQSTPTELMGFFPAAIKVHQGDVLHFSGGFHTVTLLPEGADPVSWRPERAEWFGEGAWGLATADEDEGDDVFKANTRVLFPSRLDCGGPDADPCPFDGSAPPGGFCPTREQQYFCFDGVLNSGPPMGEGGLDFSVEVTADPGTTVWAVCLVHKLMTMKIEVVDDAEAASDAGAIASAVAARRAAGFKAAAAAHKRFSSARPRAAGGVWSARVGTDGPGFSLFAMYPKTLTIRRGDTVRFLFDDLRYEVHTASLPLDPALEVANNFITLVCDLDGDGGPLPDTQTLPNFPFCPAGPAQLEFDLAEGLATEIGDGVYTGEDADLETSGWGGPDGWRGRDPYEVRFDSPGSFTYVCMIHPSMRGKIVVR